MPPIRSEQQVQRLLEGLVAQTVKDAAPRYARKTVGPLLAKIQRAPARPDGEPDMEFLLDTLPDVFDEMDSDGIEQSLELMLTQVGKIGQAVGTPRDFDKIARTQKTNPFEDDLDTELALSIDFVQVADFQPKKARDLENLFASKVPVSSTAFDALKRESKARAFRIAGFNKASLIKNAQNIIRKGLRDGISPRDIQRRLVALFSQEGFTAPATNRLHLLIRQNMYTTYAVAKKRISDSPAVRAAFPYRKYVTARDKDVRPAHAALDGLIIRKSDPLWDRILPPWEPECRCSSIDVSQAEVDRKGGNKKAVVDGNFVFNDLKVEGQDARGVVPNPDFDFDRDQLGFIDQLFLRSLEGRLRDIIEGFIKERDDALLAVAV